MVARDACVHGGWFWGVCDVAWGKTDFHFHRKLQHLFAQIKQMSAKSPIAECCQQSRSPNFHHFIKDVVSVIPRCTCLGSTETVVSGPSSRMLCVVVTGEYGEYDGCAPAIAWPLQILYYPSTEQW